MDADFIRDPSPPFAGARAPSAIGMVIGVPPPCTHSDDRSAALSYPGMTRVSMPASSRPQCALYSWLHSCFPSLHFRWAATTMVEHHFASTLIALAVLAFWTACAHAGMGRCVPADNGSLICGSGNGAARVIPKTVSPSGRLGLAWRVVDAPPTVQPRADDPGLESLIVRIEDGAILATERGTYWDIGERYAPKQYVRAAWSPDSQLLIRTVQHANKPDSAELFALAENDSISLPFELRKIFELAVQAEMNGVKDASSYRLKFNYKPDPMIDNRGLIHASVYMEANKSESTPSYELTAQATRGGTSLDAKVVSISQHRGPYISITVH